MFGNKKLKKEFEDELENVKQEYESIINDLNDQLREQEIYKILVELFDSVMSDLRKTYQTVAEEGKNTRHEGTTRAALVAVDDIFKRWKDAYNKTIEVSKDVVDLGDDE